jgi:hypothetical protein
MRVSFPNKRSTARLFLVFLICFSLAVFASSESLWKLSNYSFFKNTKEYAIGDLITVVVSERTEASQNASSSGSKDGSVAVNPGGGLLNFIPLISASGELEHSASGSMSKDNMFQTSITTKIVEILPNDIFKIEGRRIIKIDGVLWDFQLRSKREAVGVNHFTLAVSLECTVAGVCYRSIGQKYLEETFALNEDIQRTICRFKLALGKDLLGRDRSYTVSDLNTGRYLSSLNNRCTGSASCLIQEVLEINTALFVAGCIYVSKVVSDIVNIELLSDHARSCSPQRTHHRLTLLSL